MSGKHTVIEYEPNINTGYCCVTFKSGKEMRVLVCKLKNRRTYKAGDGFELDEVEHVIGDLWFNSKKQLEDFVWAMTGTLKSWKE